MTGGTWSRDPGPPPWARGSIYKKKVLQDPGPNTHTAATIHKEVLTPPPSPPPPQKKGYPGAGGHGGQNPKNYWGVIFGPKMMILQGVRRQKPYIGVCYANDPKKGGYTTLAPALDLTTSLRGDFGPLVLLLQWGLPLDECRCVQRCSPMVTHRWSHKAPNASNVDP